jgi:hypothetical protein
VTGDQLIFNFGITLKASEQEDVVRRGTSTIYKKNDLFNDEKFNWTLEKN